MAEETKIEGEGETQEFQRGPEYQDYLRTCRKQVSEFLDSIGVKNVNEISDPNEEKEVRSKIKEIMESNKPKLMRNEKLAALAGKPTRFESATEYYQRKRPGNYFRFCNRNDLIQSDWMSKGMKKVIAEDDKFGNKGEPIYDGDLVLMECPRQVYVDNVRKPAKEKADYRKNILENVQQAFAEEGARAGVETFGKIGGVVTDKP